MKTKILDFTLWLFNPLEWQRRKTLDIITDHAREMSMIFEQVAQEAQEPLTISQEFDIMEGGMASL